MEAEPGSLPPSLPPAPDQADWLERVAVWKQRVAEVAGDSKHKVVGALAVVMALILGGAWFTQTRPGPPVETLLPQVDPSAVEGLDTTPDPSATPLNIVVHVAGAVVRPGLVELQLPARVADAVDAAGGPTALGDLDRLNLATLLEDEDRVVVPALGEDAPALVDTARNSGTEAVGPVDLNQASPAELELLPGIGPATAAAIVAYRADNGPFASVTALDEVPGIGPAKLAQLRDLVSVGP